jgi:purine-nucleoside phosphorylase
MDKKRFFEFAFGCSCDTLYDRAIITPVLSVDKFTEGAEAKSVFRGRLYSGVNAVKNGVGFTVIKSGIGDRLLGDAVLLLAVSPVKELVFAGSCGGFNDVKVGDILICENAFDGEGFSKYFDEGFNMSELFSSGKAISADTGYASRLKEFIAVNSSKSYASGNIFTIGSFMAEESDFVKNIEEKGFSGIELELSAVYSAARAAGLKAAALTVVSDLPLVRPLWDLTKEERVKYNNGVSEMVRLLSEFMVSG